MKLTTNASESKLLLMKAAFEAKYTEYRGNSPRHEKEKDRIRYVANKDPVFFMVVLAKMHKKHLKFIPVITPAGSHMLYREGRTHAVFNPYKLKLEISSDDESDDYDDDDDNNNGSDTESSSSSSSSSSYGDSSNDEA